MRVKIQSGTDAQVRAATLYVYVTGYEAWFPLTTQQLEQLNLGDLTLSSGAVGVVGDIQEATYYSATLYPVDYVLSSVTNPLIRVSIEQQTCYVNNLIF